MPRYVSLPKRPRAYWDDDVGEVYDRAVTVFEPEEPADTGLLDASGQPIYRVRDPIGFAVTREET